MAQIKTDERDYSDDSRERREIPYEQREAQELENLQAIAESGDEPDKIDWLIFKVFPNNSEYHKGLKKAEKRKSRKGSYSPTLPRVKVVYLRNTHTTTDYLFKLIRKGGTLEKHNLTAKVRREAIKDDRLAKIIEWVEDRQRLTKPVLSAKQKEALEKKFKADYEKKLKEKADAEQQRQNN